MHRDRGPLRSGDDGGRVAAAVVLLLAIAVAGDAAGAEACPDAVPALVEQSCPCQGARTAYRRCVRRVLVEVVSDGRARRSCQAALRRSTCGRPGAVVCCEERVASGARACRIRRPRRCVADTIVRRAADAATSCAAACVVSPTTTTTTSTTFPPSWAAIHAAAIGPRCGTCHASTDGEGELDGLHRCRTAYVNLVGVPSAELPERLLVAPGDPDASWLVQKLDGTQSAFDELCVDSSCGGAMPLGETLLPARILAALRTWIADGAIDDCP